MIDLQSKKVIVDGEELVEQKLTRTTNLKREQLENQKASLERMKLDIDAKLAQINQMLALFSPK